MNIQIKLKPFTTPNFVVEEKPSGSGRGEGASFPLKAVSPDELSAMCDQFREDVFAKAEKKDPRLQ